MTKEKKILITNDDGIDSDGIRRLAAAARKFGQVWVVAPDGQRSAMSHSITLRKEIDAYPYAFGMEGICAYKTTGTPADCVRIGMLNLVPGGADVVMSGINYGYNCATDIQYSATAGAAFEAAFQKAHAIAFSEGASACHEVTDAYLEEVMAELMEAPLSCGQIWNVNFPDCRLMDCRGVLRERTVSCGGFFRDRYKAEKLGDGGIRFMVNGIYNEDAEEGTDFGAIVDKYVSIGIATNVK